MISRANAQGPSWATSAPTRVLMGALMALGLSLPASGQVISNQTVANGSTAGTGNGQSFTMPIAGSITRISLMPSVAYSGTLYLYTGASGSGSLDNVGSPERTQTGVTLDSTPVAGPFRHITLAQPFPVAAGNAYSFVLSGPMVAFARGGGTDGYAGGMRLMQYVPITWIYPTVVQDLVFQIWATSAQTISFTTPVPAAANVGEAPYTPGATATSGLPVTFTVDPTSAGVCTLTGGSVAFIGPGICTVNADQAGTLAADPISGYEPAPRVQQNIAVSLLTTAQTISFTSTAPATAHPGSPTYTPVATATSGLPVIFTIDPASAGVCTLTSGAVSFIGVGTCIVNADQPGTLAADPVRGFEPAPQVQQRITVAAVAVPVPALSQWMLAVLGLLLGGLALRRGAVRRR